MKSYYKSLINFIAALLITSSVVSAQVNYDLTDFDEDLYLGENSEARLLSVNDEPSSFDAEKKALILVHGINGRPADLQFVLDTLKHKDYQFYVLAYADVKRRTLYNGTDFAKELLKLKAKDVTIIGHSIGAIVSRVAMVEIIQQQKQVQFKKLNLHSIDTSWSGYLGPSDEGAFDILQMALARLLMQDGYEDMRAKSNMFKTIHSVQLPSHFEFSLSFAQSGWQAIDYTEYPLKKLIPEILRSYKTNTAFKANDQVTNFWKTMKSAHTFRDFDAKLKQSLQDETLSLSVVEKLMKEYFPQYPGNHMSVLGFQYGESTFLNYLDSKL